MNKYPFYYEVRFKAFKYDQEKELLEYARPISRIFIIDISNMIKTVYHYGLDYGDSGEDEESGAKRTILSTPYVWKTEEEYEKDRCRRRFDEESTDNKEDKMKFDYYPNEYLIEKHLPENRRCRDFSVEYMKKNEKMNDRRILYWYFRAMWHLAGRWVLLIIVAFWIIGSLLPDAEYPEKEPHWKNEDPARHPSEVKKLDYNNRLIIWKTPEEIERDKFVPKQDEKPTTTKYHPPEPEEIDIEEWIELNMD